MTNGGPPDQPVTVNPTPEQVLDAVTGFLTAVVNAIEGSEAWANWNALLAMLGMNDPMNPDIRERLTKGGNYDHGKLFAGPVSAMEATEYVLYWYNLEGIKINAATYRGDEEFGAGNAVRDDPFGIFANGWPPRPVQPPEQEPSADAGS